MNTVFGIQGRDCVIIAADTIQAKDILCASDKNLQIRPISKYCMLGVKFSNWLSSHFRLYELRNGYSLDSKAIVHFTRNQVVDNLRIKCNHQVSMLLGGYDGAAGPSLNFISDQSALHSFKYTGRGVGRSICESIFSMMWKPDLTLEQAHEIVRLCVAEMKMSFSNNLRRFDIFVEDKYDVRELESLSPSLPNLL